jgi:hypothetical protein
VGPAILFPLLAGVGGAVSGLLLGAAGGDVPLDVRLALSSVLAPVGVLIGALESVGRPLRPLQCDRETPKRWVEQGYARWSIKNGLALGCGASSGVGFWLWYLVPVGAFLFGSAALGFLIYGAYGLVRGLGVWAFLLARVSADSESVLEDLSRRMRLATSVTGIGLVFVCALSLGGVSLS